MNQSNKGAVLQNVVEWRKTGETESAANAPRPDTTHKALSHLRGTDPTQAQAFNPPFVPSVNNPSRKRTRQGNLIYEGLKQMVQKVTDNNAKLNLQSLSQFLAIASLLVGFFVVQDRRITTIEIERANEKKAAEQFQVDRKNELKTIDDLREQVKGLRDAIELLMDDGKPSASKRERIRRRINQYTGQNPAVADEKINSLPR